MEQSDVKKLRGENEDVVPNSEHGVEDDYGERITRRSSTPVQELRNIFDPQRASLSFRNDRTYTPYIRKKRRSRTLTH